MALHPNTLDPEGCLEDDVIAAFVGGELDAAQRERVEAHVDRCIPCRRLVSVLAKRSEPELATSGSADSSSGGAPAAAPAAHLERGAVLGRFVVLERIGSGGMGTVYAAYDPELDRRVALKLLHTDVQDREDERSPLIREAQAMARVAHPNVVAVHDVGSVEGRIFVAMEFVEGTTLRAWLRERSRSSKEILATFVAAGRGLAAAHGAGLVHRDFKPDNVLIGKDGRARVTDFGLARTMVQAVPAAVVGTPAYMSPEQHSGLPADARSDQFSFCVALYQALYGELPFDGTSLESVRSAVQAGRLRVPSASVAARVDRPIRRALARGLRADPDARFPSMDALLEELVQGPRRSKMRWAMSLGVVVAALAAGAFVVHARSVRAAMCREGDAKLAGVWEVARKQAVRTRFLSVDRPFAKDALATVESTMDAYTARWATSYRASCEAARVTRQQSEETFALQSACLERRLDEVRALEALLETADDVVVEHAPSAVRKLTPVDVCDRTAALVMQPIPPVDPAVRANVTQLRRVLDDARALLDSGKYAAGLAVVDPGVARARQIGYPAILAEALYLQGSLRDQLSDFKGAEESLYEAAKHADVARHDRVSAEAWALLVWVVGYREARHEVGRALAEPARAAILRAGEAPELVGPFENNLGTLVWSEGNYGDALGHYERAALAWEKAYGSEHPFVADALNNRALVLWNQGQYTQSLDAHQHALAIRRKLLGDEHPVVAGSLNNVGMVLTNLAEYDEAADYLRRAIAIRERALGSDNPVMANSLNNYGLALLGAGHDEEARTALERAFAIRRRSRPPDHPDIANSLVNLAMAYAALGQLDRALSSIEEGRALQSRILGDGHPDLVETLTIYASIGRRAKRTSEALVHAQHAVTLAEKAFPPNHPTTVLALDELGRSQLAVGDAAHAATTLERASELRRTTPGDPLDEAVEAFALGQARVQSGRPDGLALAREARGRLSALVGRGNRVATSLAEADAWLATHAAQEK